MTGRVFGRSLSCAQARIVSWARLADAPACSRYDPATGCTNWAQLHNSYLLQLTGNSDAAAGQVPRTWPHSRSNSANVCCCKRAHEGLVDGMPRSGASCQACSHPDLPAVPWLLASIAVAPAVADKVLSSWTVCFLASYRAALVCLLMPAHGLLHV